MWFNIVYTIFAQIYLLHGNQNHQLVNLGLYGRPPTKIQWACNESNLPFPVWFPNFVNLIITSAHRPRLNITKAIQLVILSRNEISGFTASSGYGLEHRSIKFDMCFKKIKGITLIEIHIDWHTFVTPWAYNFHLYIKGLLRKEFFFLQTELAACFKMLAKSQPIWALQLSMHIS